MSNLGANKNIDDQQINQIKSWYCTWKWSCNLDLAKFARLRTIIKDVIIFHRNMQLMHKSTHTKTQQ